MAAIPAEYLDLLQQKTAFAHLATIMPDGTPQVTPVWFDYNDGKPDKFRKGSREGAQHAGRRARGAFNTRPRQSLSLHPDPWSG
jgi:hypothetical protein